MMSRSKLVYLPVLILFIIFVCFKFCGENYYELFLNKLNQDFFVNILQILAVFIGFIGAGLGIILQGQNNSNIASINVAGLKNNLIEIYKFPLYLSFFGILFALFLILLNPGIDIPGIKLGIVFNDFKMIFLLIFVLIISSYYRGIVLLFNIIKQ